MTDAKEEKISSTIAGNVAKPIKNDYSANLRLIRDVISNSSFEWTSLKRIISKTGFDRDKIMETVRKDHTIIISIGNKSKDHIFKLKQ